MIDPSTDEAHLDGGLLLPSEMLTELNLGVYWRPGQIHSDNLTNKVDTEFWPLCPEKLTTAEHSFVAACQPLSSRSAHHGKHR
jgi:hypothetical protein